MQRDRVVDPQELFRWVETPLDGRVELWREIPAGEFQMGSPKGEGYDDERPRHRVRVLSPFRMAAVPVTNAQYAVFEPEHESFAWEGVPREDLAHHPVVNVSWYKAAEFCRWLAETFSWARGARLPTEEEWEYACRAGTKTRYWSGDSQEDLERVGWYGKGLEGTTHRVGEKPANHWGLYDVHGNVWEWTQSPQTADYKRREAEIDPASVEPADPAAPPSGILVARGGSYWDGAVGAPAACRSFWDPGIEDQVRGFRVVLPGPTA